MSGPRVVITGVGPVSPIGVGAAAFCDGVVSGLSGVRRGAAIAGSGATPRLAAAIDAFDIANHLDSQKAYLDRSSQFALAAVSLALKDAGLPAAGMEKAGIALGSAYGSLETMRLFFDDLLDKGPRLVRPFLFPHTYANTAISLAAMEFGIRGFHINFSSGGVASAHALAAAYDCIRLGKAAIVLAGGYEALSPPLLAGCEALGLLTPCSDPSAWPGPLGTRGNGIVPGEGAGVLVLEEREHARARGARVYGEIVAAALTGEPESAAAESLSAALTNAMRAAAVTQPDLVVACANGHPAFDAAEARALSSLAADGGRSPALLRFKGAIGEMFGAAAALAAIAALAALDRQRLPPTAPGEGAPAPMETALVNAADAGGSAAAMLLRREVTA